MLKEIGLLVNCGRWRFSKEPKRDIVSINFVFSVEALDEETTEIIDELRAAVQETIAGWSRAGWRKMKKQEREQKAARKLLQQERKEQKHGNPR